jgi:uncharacterized DUF497 family protein
MRRTFVGFDWDDGNRDKCCAHGLSIAEVEFVLAHQETLIVPDEKHSVFERRFIAVGRTETGRYAFVIFTPRDRGGSTRVRPVSARYMHQKEIDRYAQEVSGSEDR